MTRIVTNLDTKQHNQLDSFEKGRLFEEYVIKLFSERYFELKEWRRSEKIIDPFLLSTYSNPDLELVFMGVKKHRFAIECKWKNKFIDGKIAWAPERKIRVYKEFQNKTGMPVFIAIGIGGSPSSPEKLFVTPLDHICKCSEVYESGLIPYKRKPTNKFFYDTVQLRLW